MKVVKTVDAQGLILCQDITKIVRGEYKGAIFAKGHQVTSEDIPVLLSLGKEHLFLASGESDLIHENEAANFLYYLITGEFMQPTPVSEGKIEVVAEVDGLLKVNKELLFKLNSIGKIAVATLKGNQKVAAGQKVAGTRIIPLEIEPEKLMEAERLIGEDSIVTLIPFKPVTVGIVTTGSEVFNGLIEDSFTPVVKEKLSHYPSATITFHEIVNDDPVLITKTIEEMLEKGADIVFCTGGMSVDPDDRTPLAIKQTGAKIISHGTPVIPGSMLLLAYLEGKTIVGLPGGVMFSKQTVFDLLLPKIIAQDNITKEEIAHLGYGGYL
ncbi:molybdenum cofactor biosynthesis protein MoaB [Enterococcus silesiacus]|uniref:Molybdopterin molybdenumtransferase n=1 Tax=Enterococcus silesiacus TaxID=332949 RepID=A0A0S3K702_9ENTE|nr:molybdopterin-binding protein [Enterococcus silesiacus]ALS00002.1 molybdenum cofactor biosynthesis protein MoaB [Enterococcus silesiacus]OJG92684.1 molybdenum cofactor synthesis domain-containing protein [Enterococcus silesiacus]